MQPKIAEYSSGLDWLTFTSHSDEEQRQSFVEWQRRKREFLRKEGVSAREAKMQAYRGERLGDWEFLQRCYDGHHMVRCHGDGANDLAQEIIESNVQGKCTRIDAQITATFDSGNPRYADLLKRQVRAKEQRNAARARQKLSLHEGCTADTGLTLGDRSSAVYFRIYDYEAKHCLSTSTRVWRFEGELKGEAATQFWQQYRLSREPHKLCARTVNTRLQKYGIYEEAFSHMDANPVSGTKPASDIEKRKQYTQKTLLPHLAKSVELGLVDFLLGALQEHGILDSLGLVPKAQNAD
jgi:hypothetical protein